MNVFGRSHFNSIPFYFPLWPSAWTEKISKCHRTTAQRSINTRRRKSRVVFFLCLIRKHFSISNWNNMEIRDATESESSKTSIMCYISDTIKEQKRKRSTDGTLFLTEWSEKEHKNTININICETRFQVSAYLFSKHKILLLAFSTLLLLIMCWIAFCMIASRRNSKLSPTDCPSSASIFSEKLIIEMENRFGCVWLTTNHTKGGGFAR
jgi:hypothetical protein